MKIQSVKSMAIGIGVMLLVPFVADLGIRLVIKEPAELRGSQRDGYRTNYFYMASAVGITSILAGFVAPAELGMGLVLGGVFTLVWGYLTAWNVLSDIIKFITLLVALVLLVLGGFKMIKSDQK